MARWTNTKNKAITDIFILGILIIHYCKLGVDRYVFFRADTDTDY